MLIAGHHDLSNLYKCDGSKMEVQFKYDPQSSVAGSASFPRDTPAGFGSDRLLSSITMGFKIPITDIHIQGKNWSAVEKKGFFQVVPLGNR